MEYSIQKFAQMSGVSTRTLRYYHQLELLIPKRISSSGYRIYGGEEVDRLQQILFYKELGLELGNIKEILDTPSFDRVKALAEHRKSLIEKKERLIALISNVEKTIASAEGRIDMKDKEKFEGFKVKAVEENETKYGKEVREKYGSDIVEKSNKKFLNMTQEEYAKVTVIEKELFETLEKAMAEGNPKGDLGQKAAELHRQWLSFFWQVYDKNAHAGIAQMYVDDPRFSAYYDKVQEGASEFLKDAIIHYTSKL